MIRLALPLIVLLAGAGVAAQDSPPPAPPGEIFEVVEQEPELIGGLEGLQARVVYPENARRQGIEGTAYVQFVVDERGRVVTPRVVRGHPELGQAAVKALAASRFRPGRHEGRAVKVRYTLPVRFVLSGDVDASPPPEPEPASTDEVYEVVEQEPELIGGLVGLQNRVEYPEDARRAGVQGTLYVQFVVRSDGAVSESRIVRAQPRVPRDLIAEDGMLTPEGREAVDQLAEAALRAVDGSRFVPGMQRGEPVSVRYTLPVRFVLR